MTKNKTNKFMLMGAAGLLSILIMIAVMAINHVTPFGNRNLLASDVGAQYSPFLTMLQHMLKTHTLSLYSFNVGIGSNLVALISYYLMSPFNLLLIFFKSSQVPIFITLVIILKIGLSAVAMNYFLQRHFETQSWATVLFANAYSLCGFVATNYFNLMWLDSLIWLPLIITGVDQLYRNRKFGMLFGWLSVSIITNYYLGYMTCIFVGLYAVYLVFVNREETQSIKSTLKNSWSFIGKVLQIGILSALTSMVVLLPTALEMFKTAKVNTNQNLPWNQFGLDILTQLGMGGTNFNSHLVHAPTIYSSLFVALLVLFYFVHPAISRIYKRTALVMLLVLLLTMWITPLNLVWHMLQEPVGFPFRNVFFYSFFAVMLAFQVWQAGIRQITGKRRWLIPGGLIAALSVGFVAAKWGPKLTDGGIPIENVDTLVKLTINCGYVVVLTIVLFWLSKRVAQVVLVGMVAGELFANFYSGMHGFQFGNQANYERQYQKETMQFQPVANTSNLVRAISKNRNINVALQRYRNYNDSALFNFSDVSSYTSTLTVQDIDLLNNFGAYVRNARRVSNMGLVNPMSAILGAKYNVTTKGAVHRIPEYQGTGMTVPVAFTKVSGKQPFISDNLNDIMTSLDNKNTKFIMLPKVVDQVTDLKTRSRYHYQHVERIKINRTGKLYLDAQSYGINYGRTTVNGKPLYNFRKGTRRFYLIGHFRKGQTVIVKTRARDRTNKRIRFVMLNNQNIRKTLKQHPSSVIHKVGNDSHLQFKIKANSGQYYYLPIPIDSGWHATVNGKSVGLKSVLGGLTAVPLTSGTNQVKLAYQAPGIKAGLLLSLLGLIGFGWLEFRNRKRS